jgi:putative flippase GtrA
VKRLMRAPAFLRFAAVGTAGFVVNAVFFYVAFYFLALGKDASWVFAVEWAKFVATNAFGAVVNFLTYRALISFAPPPFNYPLLALAAGVLMGLIFNFTLSKRLVFRPR